VWEASQPASDQEAARTSKPCTEASSTPKATRRPQTACSVHPTRCSIAMPDLTELDDDAIEGQPMD
jgi:hypothetical protein